MRVLADVERRVQCQRASAACQHHNQADDHLCARFSHNTDILVQSCNSVGGLPVAELRRRFTYRNVREAVGRSNCHVGWLLFFVICRRKRAGTILVQRSMTRRGSQSTPMNSVDDNSVQGVERWPLHRAESPPPILYLESVQILSVDVTVAFEDLSPHPSGNLTEALSVSH